MATGSSESGLKSVGKDMLAGETYGLHSRKYQVYCDQLLQQLRGVLSDKATATIVKSPVYTALAPEQTDVSRLADMYPEFRLRATAARAGLHTGFELERQMALAWCVRHARRYGCEVSVAGDMLFQAVMTADKSLHVEYTQFSSLGIHSDMQAGLDVARSGSVAVRPTTDGDGIVTDQTGYADFLTAKAYNVCRLGHKCVERCDVAVFDGSMYPVTQVQVAAGMKQCGADVGYMLLPYRPEMLFQEAGELDGTGIEYTRSGDELLFHQPNGAVMTCGYNGAAWYQWLSRSSFADAGVGYATEILQTRGNFAFVQVTRLGEGSYAKPVKHTLEVCADEKNPKVVVVCDVPRDMTSVTGEVDWVRETRVFDKRLYDKLYSYGMSLQREDFAKDGLQALLKRAYVGDNRVTYGGGYVDVQMPLSVVDAHRLVAVVFARVFVDRFEMVAMGNILRGNVADLEAYSRLSRTQRMGYVFCALLDEGWTHWTGTVDGWVSHVFGFVLDRNKARRSQPKVQPMATVWDFQQALGAAGKSWDKTYGVDGKVGLDVYGLRGYQCRKRGFGSGVRVGRKGIHLGKATLAPSVVGGVTVRDTMSEVDELVDLSESRGPRSAAVDRFVSVVTELDDVGVSVSDRFLFERPDVAPDLPEVELPPVGFDYDPDYITTINEVTNKMFGLYDQNARQDASSLAVDPQELHMDPGVLRLPVVEVVNGVPDAKLYTSNVRAYSTDMRINTAKEMLWALQNRNFSPSVVSEPQNVDLAVHDAFEVFLDRACIPEARVKLAEFEMDPVAMEQEVLAEWAGKQTAENLERLVKSIVADGRALEEIPLHEYQAMLKADAKPPMSGKPMVEQPAPQTIAFQDKHASAMFSAVLRVITRRYLALQKPNWLVSILKDSKGVAGEMAKFYPWDEDPAKVWFLENDFSKYDKSQGEFCTALKLYAYKRLGLSSALLARWSVAQKIAFVKCMALGIEYVVHEQQKSGDGATTFANVLVNEVAVCNAYRSTEVDFASFIGDDSAIVSRKVAVDSRSVRLMAEVYNLQSKYIIGRWLYYTSQFWKFDYERRRVYPIPDPAKKSQRFSQSRPESTDFKAVYEGVYEDCQYYLRKECWAGLEYAVVERYPGPSLADVTALFNALATAVSSYDNFRAMWIADPELVHRAS